MLTAVYVAVAFPKGESGPPVTYSTKIVLSIFKTLRMLLYADDLVVIAQTEDDLIEMLNEWKDFVENRGMRVNMNKTKVMISGERQKVMQKAVKWPCGVCGRGVGNNSIQCTSCQKWVHRKCSGIKGRSYKVMKTFGVSE